MKLLKKVKFFDSYTLLLLSISSLLLVLSSKLGIIFLSLSILSLSLRALCEIKIGNKFSPSKG